MYYILLFFCTVMLMLNVARCNVVMIKRSLKASQRQPAEMSVVSIVVSVKEHVHSLFSTISAPMNVPLVRAVWVVIVNDRVWVLFCIVL